MKRYEDTFRYKVAHALGIVRPSRIFAEFGNRFPIGFRAGVIDGKMKALYRDMYMNPVLKWIPMDFNTEMENKMRETVHDMENWW